MSLRSKLFMDTFFNIFMHFSLTALVESEPPVSLIRNLATATLDRLDYRLMIKDEFVAASILDPGQVHSPVILKYLNSEVTPLDLLKSFSLKYQLDALMSATSSSATASLSATTSSSAASSPSATTSSSVASSSSSSAAQRVSFHSSNIFLFLMLKTII